MTVTLSWKPSGCTTPGRRSSWTRGRPCWYAQKGHIPGARQPSRGRLRAQLSQPGRPLGSRSAAGGLLRRSRLRGRAGHPGAPPEERPPRATAPLHGRLDGMDRRQVSRSQRQRTVTRAAPGSLGRAPRRRIDLPPPSWRPLHLHRRGQARASGRRWPASSTATVSFIRTWPISSGFAFPGLKSSPAALLAIGFLPQSSALGPRRPPRRLYGRRLPRPGPRA